MTSEHTPPNLVFWSMHGQIWQKVKILPGADYWVLTRSTEPQMDGFWDLSGIKDGPVSKNLAVKAYIFGALMDYFWELMVFLNSLILCQKSANLKKFGNFEPYCFE